MRTDPALIEELDARIAACLELPVQVRGGPHRTAVDPLRGSRVLFNPARSQRPRRGDAGCPFCTGQTPPSLFYVTPAGPRGEAVASLDDLASSEVRPGRIVIEREEESLRLLREFAKDAPFGEQPDPWEAIRLLMGHAHPGPFGSAVPLVHPGEPWLMRTFLNFVPVIVDPDGAANCFVLSGPPPFHYSDVGILVKDAEEGRPTPILPVGVVEALLESWTVLEGWCAARGLISVPFVNAGKSPASGQSLECFHSQLYALAPKDTPPLFQRLAEERRRRCPVCAIIDDDELHIATFGSVAVAVHPAPTRNLTFVVAPVQEVPDLSSLEASREFASALSWAVRRYESLLGGVPAYVIALRAGDLVGHLHAEVVPRSYVNVPGGFEETTGFAVTTRDPRAVAASLRGEG